MGCILQHRQNKVEGVKKVQQLTLKVWNASTKHVLHSSAYAEQGLGSQEGPSTHSESMECFYKPWVTSFSMDRTRLRKFRRSIASLWRYGMLLQTMGRIIQHGQNKAEEVQKVHRLTLKVWNASTNHGPHHSAWTEQGWGSSEGPSPCSEVMECFYKPWLASFSMDRTRLRESRRFIDLL